MPNITKSASLAAPAAALLTSVNTLKLNTDQFNFDVEDNALSTVVGQEVTLSKIDNIYNKTEMLTYDGSDVMMTLTENVELDAVQNNKLDLIKDQTQKISFTGSDLHATMNGEQVVLASDGFVNIATDYIRGVNVKFGEMLVQVWDFLYSKTRLVPNAEILTNYRGNTVLTTQKVAPTTTGAEVDDAQ